MNLKMRSLFLRCILASVAGALGLRVQAADRPPQGSLKEAAASLFEIGVGINDRIADRAEDHRLLLAQFGMVTPENCMKPAKIQAAEGKWDFAQADAFVDFATKNGLKVVGHCLVWAKDDRTPAWFFRDGDKPASREVLLERMRRHIEAEVTRYRGRIAMWDVVNEALDDGGEYLRVSGWSAACGEEFIARAFEYAHAADPDAMLIYNDYNNELPAKREKQIRLVRSLLEKKVPVHAVGLQGHYEIDRVPFKEIEETLVAMRELGVKVAISELDIDVIPRGKWWAEGGKHREELSRLDPYRDGCPPDVLERQAEQYARLFEIFRRHSDVIARVSFWNLHDGQSWLNDFPWKRVNHPLLFDRQRNAKPAFGAVMSVLNQPRTPAAAQEVQAKARNPVIWADVPDVAVIRVGDTYYMASTTMHMSPGLPIMKSRDLVNWEMVSYAYDTLGDSDELAMRNGKSCYSRGSWAPSLRHHNGTFYATTFSATTGRTYIYTTKDPEREPWKEISFRPSLHDHSLFFDDDGRVYMVYGAGDIRLTELNPDLSGIKTDGVNQVIVKNAGAVASARLGLPAEGSHLRKIDGKYYLSNICWPRGGMRTQLTHRADALTGPYEGRVSLQDKGVAQGGLIDTPDGKWYALLFQDNGAVGRTPFLVPVEWKDGWPVMGIDGKMPMTLDVPAVKGGMSNIVASDEFDRSPGEPALPLAWQWNHNPDDRFWSLAERPGWLRLKNGQVDKSIVETQNTLTQRTFGPQCSGSICLDVSNMKDGDVAGLAAFQKNYGFVGVKMAGGEKSVVMVSAENGSPREVASVPLTRATVHLKVVMDFTNRADRALFYYSPDGKEWHAIGSSLKMSYTIPHFMGYRFALFNHGTETAGGSVDFDYFRLGNEGHK